MIPRLWFYLCVCTAVLLWLSNLGRAPTLAVQNLSSSASQTPVEFDVLALPATEEDRALLKQQMRLKWSDCRQDPLTQYLITLHGEGVNDKEVAVDPFKEISHSNGDVKTLELDVMETSEAFTIVADIPGVSSFVVEICAQLGGRTLIAITGTRAVEEEHPGPSFILKERNAHIFHRIIPLPGYLVPRRIPPDPEVHDGVLTVKLPTRLT